ncbi:CRISPR-associated endonuclease Cas2 [Salisediminibacterium halotolerans]|uniref:CRISPR-associated endoribonuclease Cas2 n=1 Tax=Salisediminibacterium halotolerans TaxID=517425 RepID=A0A1H9T5K2_9BACI|nr:CRISPR-associated endonuclease Cas2 [Salisediminibacterium haloalkalitolerans]SER92525.1 CRISPR-associated protein Cas2 [Salisediminibacterium haloalkalitolerans]
MLVLITYDVSTSSESGAKRLRQVAKICERYGQRVQNSVFECYIDNSQYVMVKNDLKKVIKVESDSLRFYQIGNKYKNKVEHIGITLGFDMEDPLIF